MLHPFVKETETSSAELMCRGAHYARRIKSHYMSAATNSPPSWRKHVQVLARAAVDLSNQCWCGRGDGQSQSGEKRKRTPSPMHNHLPSPYKTLFPAALRAYRLPLRVRRIKCVKARPRLFLRLIGVIAWHLSHLTKVGVWTYCKGIFVTSCSSFFLVTFMSVRLGESSGHLAMCCHPIFVVALRQSVPLLSLVLVYTSTKYLELLSFRLPGGLLRYSYYYFLVYLSIFS